MKVLTVILGLLLLSCTEKPGAGEAVQAFTNPLVQAKILALVKAGVGTPCLVTDKPRPQEVIVLVTLPTGTACRNLPERRIQGAGIVAVKIRVGR